MNFLRTVLLGGLGLWCSMASLVAAPAVTTNLWQEIDQALEQGLPRTALERAEAVESEARRAKSWGPLARAIALRIEIQGRIEGNQPEERIRRLDIALADAPAPVIPLLQTIQAQWYWQYFQQNRWRFLERASTRTAPGDDFTTWDLRRLFAEIDRRFTLALQGAQALQRVPVADFDGLLTPGALPDRYRPTLYDFIAHQALQFYTSGEQAGAQPEDAFVLAAGGGVFAPTEKFLTWRPEVDSTATAPESPLPKAIALYQALIRFHHRDADPTAGADADLARIEFGWQHAVGPDKQALYETALRRFIDTWADHEIAAIALYRWAELKRSNNALQEAHDLARRGRQIHPDSPGGALCHNLIGQIETPSLQLSAEHVWNAPCPPIQIRYRNLTNAYFRVVAWDWNDFLRRDRSRPETLTNPEERRELLNREPVLHWAVALEPTPDFREQSNALPAPAHLAPGFYFLVASGDPDFGDKNNEVSFTDFWVSDLALIIRPQDYLEGFVLQAQTGNPLPGAEVVAWHLDRQGNRIPNSEGTRTDTNGFFRLPGELRSGSLVRARYRFGDTLHELGSLREYGVQTTSEPKPTRRTVFFTDRALYRPEQTILYKGICLSLDQTQDDYRVLPGQKLTVALLDPNRREIARADHVCSSNGSFFGQFTAPRSSVTGRCTLQVQGAPVGATSVHVEEYKRPKFQVTLPPPSTASRLDDTVTLTGEAQSYTGAAIDGAQVRYRVVRQVRWPDWWGWFPRPAPVSEASQEIAHGEARTDTDGSFTVTFDALPDLAVDPADEPTFEFLVSAEVTDSAGETRTAQQVVRMGYTALSASLSVRDWQETDRPVEIRIQTQTLDGLPQSAEGVLRIHRLRAPAQVERPPLDRDYRRFYWPDTRVANTDLSDPNQWPLGDLLQEMRFTTDTNGSAHLKTALDVGVYRAVLESRDRYGAKVTALAPIRVLDPGADHLVLAVPNLIAAPQWSVEPGTNFVALWGTGYPKGRAFVEIEHRGRLIQRFWTDPGQTQVRIEQPVTESMRGGFTLYLTRVQENRAYLETRQITVPWSNKNLEISWEHLTSKLEPNQRETWTAVIKKRAGTATDPDPTPAVAELVATLYDASLDAYQPHRWPQTLGWFRHDHPQRSAAFENLTRDFNALHGFWEQDQLAVALDYRGFAPFLQGMRGGDFPDRRLLRSRGGSMAVTALTRAGQIPPQESLAMGDSAMAARPIMAFSEGDADADAVSPTPPDLARVTARKNLRETAAFFPQLISDSNGVVRITFTMPEALTTWRLLGLAHDRDLRSGFIEATAVTAKDLMAQPNPPRFLREGDVLAFSVKVSNQSDTAQRGTVRLNLSEALDGESADRLLGNRQPDQPFEIPAKESRSFSWELSVPDNTGFLTYKAVAAASQLSDGEEGYLPVLSRRVFVTESLPLPIRGPATKAFRFDKLLNSGRSSTLRHQGLTVQMVSNPAWYAVMALPYLMEYPHECSEQVFNRLYANALARSIATSDPSIRKVFDQWRDTPALDSPLEKNQELKAVLIEETPWLRQAESESQARRHAGMLFDDQRLSAQLDDALDKLRAMQLDDGTWPWFPSGRRNDYITLYIATGFGRLRHLQVDIDVQPALRAWQRLDTWMTERYREIQEHPNPEDYVPSPTDALQLYGRSFFLRDLPLPQEHETALQFFLKQARLHWLKTGNRQTQGHLALALHRGGGQDNLAGAQAILRSLKEYSVTDEELGRFWRDTELSWWWYRAPIETQALMIEAFDEVTRDTNVVEELKVWMLKQKQTRDWKTTKATADAVYALLLRGRDLLASTNRVEVTVGSLDLTPGSDPGAGAVEPGTGFYERRFSAAEVVPALGDISVKKVDEGVAWGGIHWQYLEDMSRVTPHTGTPLTLSKTLYVRRGSSQGPVLEEVRGNLAVGDELVSRIELRVDRDMEYVHLKDQRGSGTEPVDVLSGVRYQDGLVYYASTRDTASHFFIDYLPKGTYVFEYALRIQHRGTYQTGLAEIQCLYAPEFNSHSGSVRLRVR